MSNVQPQQLWIQVGDLIDDHFLIRTWNRSLNGSKPNSWNAANLSLNDFPKNVTMIDRRSFWLMISDQETRFWFVPSCRFKLIRTFSNETKQKKCSNLEFFLSNFLSLFMVSNMQLFRIQMAKTTRPVGSERQGSREGKSKMQIASDFKWNNPIIRNQRISIETEHLTFT